MSRTSIEYIADKDFEEISNYYVSGSSEKLSDAQQLMLNRWRAAANILKKFPQKSIAARKLAPLFQISVRQAQIDIDNATKFWNLVNPTDKAFLQQWLIDFLLIKLAGKSVSEQTKAKYSATLERLIANIETEKLDPKLMEKNTVNIQFNVQNNHISLSEDDLKHIPESLKRKILALTASEITEDIALDIINS
jgi:hypothetical protein